MKADSLMTKDERIQYLKGQLLACEERIAELQAKVELQEITLNNMKASLEKIARMTAPRTDAVSRTPIR